MCQGIGRISLISRESGLESAEMKLPRAPSDLRLISRRAWDEVQREYELSMIDNQCRPEALAARDPDAACAARLAVEGLTTTGSPGQTVPHPLIQVQNNA